MYPVQGFGGGTGSILLDNVGCRGNETRLQHCSHRPIGINDCDHTEDAGVVCMSLGILYTCSIDHASLLLSLYNHISAEAQLCDEESKSTAGQQQFQCGVNDAHPNITTTCLQRYINDMTLKKDSTIWFLQLCFQIWDMCSISSQKRYADTL